MSIAADLAALADSLGPAVKRPLLLTGTSLEILVASLRDLEQRAAVLEAQEVPLYAATGGKVVSLASRRRHGWTGKVA